MRNKLRIDQIKCDAKEICRHCAVHRRECIYPQSNDNASASRHTFSSVDQQCRQLGQLCQKVDELANKFSLSVEAIERLCVENTALTTQYKAGSNVPSQHRGKTDTAEAPSSSAAEEDEDDDSINGDVDERRLHSLGPRLCDYFILTRTSSGCEPEWPLGIRLLRPVALHRWTSKYDPREDPPRFSRWRGYRS